MSNPMKRREKAEKFNKVWGAIELELGPQDENTPKSKVLEEVKGILKAHFEVLDEDDQDQEGMIKVYCPNCKHAASMTKAAFDTMMTLSSLGGTPAGSDVCPACGEYNEFTNLLMKGTNGKLIRLRP